LLTFETAPFFCVYPVLVYVAKYYNHRIAITGYRLRQKCRYTRKVT